MSNVIKFPEIGDELKHCSYTAGQYDDDLGISTLDRRIGICRINDSQFIIITENDEIVIKREELAEFLHVSSILVDSEKRYFPEVDLVGCDY